MKTSELIGRPLAYAVALCEGWEAYDKNGDLILTDGQYHWDIDHFNYPTDWSQGGPIIEREKINIRDEITQWSSWMWDSTKCGDVSYYGSTPLIAAMRCYVASKLGDEVEIPEELL